MPGIKGILGPCNRIATQLQSVAIIPRAAKLGWWNSDFQLDAWLCVHDIKHGLDSRAFLAQKRINESGPGTPLTVRRVSNSDKIKLDDG